MPGVLPVSAGHAGALVGAGELAGEKWPPFHRLRPGAFSKAVSTSPRLGWLVLGSFRRRPAFHKIPFGLQIHSVSIRHAVLKGHAQGQHPPRSAGGQALPKKSAAESVRIRTIIGVLLFFWAINALVGRVPRPGAHTAFDCSRLSSASTAAKTETEPSLYKTIIRYYKAFRGLVKNGSRSALALRRS